MKSLAEQYRPQSEEEILGQQNVKRVFDLLDEYIAPCYLFYGNPGCGKTSAARILVSKIENKPISTLNASDFIEYNCAMNGGVDQIKELIIDKCNLPPRQLKRKYVILDECQMLSATSQNSLLHILENPPDFLTFILCTTDPKKLVQALKSRSLQVKFEDANHNDIKSLIQRVADQEKINYDNNGLEIIAKYSSGSFRESLMLLSQFIKIGATEVKVTEVLGPSTEQLVRELFLCCFNNDKPNLVLKMANIIKSNTNTDEVLKEAFAIVTYEIAEKICGNTNAFQLAGAHCSLIKIDDIIFTHINNINPIMPGHLNFQLCFYKIIASCVTKK